MSTVVKCVRLSDSAQTPQTYNKWVLIRNQQLKLQCLKSCANDTFLWPCSTAASRERVTAIETTVQISTSELFPTTAYTSSTVHMQNSDLLALEGYFKCEYQQWMGPLYADTINSRAAFYNKQELR